MSARRIYLAGPEVFLAKWKVIARKKKAICRKYGFEGIFPMDGDLKIGKLPKRQKGRAISASNERLMASCDFVIANMTPFRGPSMDVGTSYEIGFMRALRKPVFGYTNIGGSLLTRTRTHFGKLTRRLDDFRTWEDPDGLSIEDFGLTENLMLDGAVSSSGATVIVNPIANLKSLFTDLAGFEKCLRLASRLAGATRS